MKAKVQNMQAFVCYRPPMFEIAYYLAVAMELLGSDSDEECESALSVALCKVVRVDCHRVNGYFEQITTKCLDFEFKRLLR